MKAYYAVCNCNGPISLRIEAETVEAAVQRFATYDPDDAINAAATDAEEDLDLVVDPCADAQEFADAMRSAGYEEARDLAIITPFHYEDGWMLWAPAAEVAS